MDLISNAYHTAVKCLRACYADEGIYAGVTLWDDYWARDSFFSIFGALELRDYDIAKKTLELFIRFQKRNGQFPLRISNYFILLKLIGIRIKKPLLPRYLEDKIQSYPRDQNSLFVISILEYAKKAKDKEFLQRHFDRIEKAIQWNFVKDSDNDLLVEENFYSTWMDSVRKRGKVLYTNVLHCKALESMAEICEILGKNGEAKKYLKSHQDVKEKINSLFWNGKYYSDWIDKKRVDIFSSDGNVLAVLYDIADTKKAKSIFNFIDKNNLEDFTLRTNFPKYRFLKISVSIRLSGMSDYHNGQRWLWIGAADILARLKVGMKKEAGELLKKMAEKINEYKHIYEVYEKTGKPVYRALYKSEQTFAWSSAFFVMAVKEFKKDNFK